MNPPFSWRALDAARYRQTTGRAVAPGDYATPVVDQHSAGWCGCCYLVAVVQCAEDRGHVALGSPTPRYRVSLQHVMDHFNAYAADADAWNACQGGDPLSVAQCLQTGECPLKVEPPPTRWWGFPVRTKPRCMVSDAPFRIHSVRRLSNFADVVRALETEGPLVLELGAATVRSVDSAGVVTDLAYCAPDHAVAVVGHQTSPTGTRCWIVRNSWGASRVPSDVPEPMGCVGTGFNTCTVRWSPWTGIPGSPGYFLLPMTHSNLHTGAPWISVGVSPR